MIDREKIIEAFRIRIISDSEDSDIVEIPVDEAMKILELLKKQEQRLNELEEKLRLLEYGDQDILQSGMMPAT